MCSIFTHTYGAARRQEINANSGNCGKAYLLFNYIVLFVLCVRGVHINRVNDI